MKVSPNITYVGTLYNVIIVHYIEISLLLLNYRTSGGAIIHEDKVTVTSPTAMWVKVRIICSVLKTTSVHVITCNMYLD